MQTFKATQEDISFILKTKNYKAAQNVECINCGDKWKDHWAGKSQTIPEGACVKGLEIDYANES